MKEVALPQTWEICGFAPNVRNRWLCPTYFVVHSSIIKSIRRGCDCETWDEFLETSKEKTMACPAMPGTFRLNVCLLRSESM